MPVSLGTRGQSGFEEPLGLLYDCHRRIEFFLGVLRRVAGGPAQLDAEHRRALEAGLHYFRQAAVKHTQDEEESLFPRLRQSSHPRAAEALAVMAGLEADHQSVQQRHDEVDSIARLWLADGLIAAEQQRRLQQLVQSLQEDYREHIRIEDQVLFPLAREVLSDEQVGAIGREMAQRRGLQACPSTVGAEGRGSAHEPSELYAR